MEFNNSIEELNKLEDQIKETQTFLKESSNDKNQINKLKKHRTIFSLLALLFLITSLWLYYFYNKSNTSFNNKYTKYLLQTSLDSIKLYKDSIKTFKAIDINKSKNDYEEESVNINTKKIIYNVQLAAFQDFKINTSNLNEISKNGYNKLTLGNYIKYKDAKKLKQNLKKIGFRDCFIVAHSFGNKINIEEALVLSNETEFLFK